jgi:dTDP-4-amino-4,6-dideoxygalactose transaminase
MEENGIGCAVNFRAIHTLTYFKETFGYKAEDFPIANEIGNRTISLPLYPKLSEEEVKIVCDVLKKVISQL